MVVPAMVCVYPGRVRYQPGAVQIRDDTRSLVFEPLVLHVRLDLAAVRTVVSSEDLHRETRRSVHKGDYLLSLCCQESAAPALLFYLENKKKES